MKSIFALLAAAIALIVAFAAPEPTLEVPTLNVRSLNITYTNELAFDVWFGHYTTNHYSNLVAVLRIIPMTNACPECGSANHHEAHVVNMEKWEQVQMQIVSHGQTSNPVIYRTAPVSEIVTQVVLRTRSELRQRPTVPPPIMPTNAP